MEPITLDPKAPDWRPSIVLRPPPKPFKMGPMIMEEQFNLIKFMERLYRECEKHFILLICKKIWIYLDYHPNYSKRANEEFLAIPHPAIRITINKNEYIDFFYVDQFIWPRCHVGLRAPLGANLFNWSVKDIYEVVNGIDNLINRCYPEIFAPSFYE